MTLDDPDVVREQYASEAGLMARRSVYSDVDGPDAREVAFAAVAERAPRRILEVGCGPGELAERLAREVPANVVAVDLSPRMVELARDRGVDARLGDVQALPFAAGVFDCAVAAWMLYHVPDVVRGVTELARVLRPGGRLVAVTNSERHLVEIRALAGLGAPERLSFSRENGVEVLRTAFGAVEQRDVAAWVTFAGADAIRAYVGSLVPAGGVGGEATVEEVAEPVRAGSRVTIFVAEDPR